MDGGLLLGYWKEGLGTDNSFAMEGIILLLFMYAILKLGVGDPPIFQSPLMRREILPPNMMKLFHREVTSSHW